MEDTTHSRRTGAQSLDTAYAVLRNRRRRRVVSLLADRESRVSLTELAADVAARECRADADESPADRLDEVVATLHHNHLPKLADAGALTYDAEMNTVTPRNLERLDSFSTPSDGDGV